MAYMQLISMFSVDEYVGALMAHDVAVKTGARILVGSKGEYLVLLL
jgi:hypothetical protein